MTRSRLRILAATAALCVVPLAGCDAADQLSSAEACADLIEMSLSSLREMQETLGDPQQVEQAYRDIADRFRDKAEQVDDADVRRAAEDYADQMRDLARAAANGQMPDIDALAAANQELAEACR